MGTIPAPNIVQDAEMISQNPLTEYARSVALQSEQQQLKQQQMQTQQMQQQLADQQAMTKAMHDWDGKDFDQLPELMKQHGISGPGYLQAKQNVVARQTQLATLDKDQLANLKEHHDMALGAIDAAEGVPDEQLMQHVTDTVGRLQQAGHIDPQTGSAIIQHAQSMTPSEFRPWLDIYKKGLMAESAAIAQTKTQAETHKATAEAEKAEADQWQPVAELGVMVNKKTGDQRPIQGAAGMMPPAMLEAKYVALQQKKAAGQQLSKDDAAFVKGYEKYKTLVPAAQINLQSGLLSDQAKQMAAQYYEQTGQLPSGMRSPAMSAGILNRAAGPGAGETPDIAANKRTYAAQTALQKSATSGEIAKNITAYNTAIAHAQQLQQAADALDNGDVRLLNKIGNTLGYEFGSDRSTNFNVIKNALSGEISKVFKGGEATDAEIKAVQAPFDSANSPKQLRGAIENAIHLMNSKRDALRSQYEQGMQGKPNFGGSTVKMKAPNGAVKEVSADQVEHYKSLGATVVQ